MSRLDSFIRRMQAQRAMLDRAAKMVGAVPGPVVELGLGGGRTYDHLAALFPDRAVYGFDRSARAALEIDVPAGRLVIGEIRDTLALALPRLGARAALVHNDLGVGDDTADAVTASWLAAAIEAIARPDAVVVTSFLLPFRSAVELCLPAAVAPGRYHLLRLVV